MLQLSGSFHLWFVESCCFVLMFVFLSGMILEKIVAWKKKYVPWRKRLTFHGKEKQPLEKNKLVFSGGPVATFPGHVCFFSSILPFLSWIGCVAATSCSSFLYVPLEGMIQEYESMTVWGTRMVNNPSWPYFLGGFAFVIGKFNPHPLENIHVPSFIAGIYISALYF